MNGQTDLSEITVPQQNGHKRPAPAWQPSARLHELSSKAKVGKTVMGIALFASWLLLFIMGMSLDSNQLSRYLMVKGQGINWSNLITYGLLFTPTNGALLASLAGVLGGIASNLAADNKFRHVRPDLSNTESDDFQSYMFMTETPLVSMLRGFLTYLIFIAGSYLTTFTTSDDLKNPGHLFGLTASSYFKFAVTVSLLAYLVGYDPSRMKSLINSFSLTRKDSNPNVQGTITKEIDEKTTISAKLSSGNPD